MNDHDIGPLLSRIAIALERIAPDQNNTGDLSTADAFVWHASTNDSGGWLEPVLKVNRLPLDLLKGINRQADTLLENTRRFSVGLPANNALLWGARGTGKSSLVKSVHALINETSEKVLNLVEIHREDIHSLPYLLTKLRNHNQQVILFCDDLSFDDADTSYKSLKAVLEGGIEGRPENVVFYATSNRRHLLPRDMIENERSTAINPSESVEEKVSLSDRFGLWLGFHHTDQDTYFAMIDAYVNHFDLQLDRGTLLSEAKEWSVTRGSRSGRVAWQYIQDLAGRQGKKLD